MRDRENKCEKKVCKTKSWSCKRQISKTNGYQRLHALTYIKTHASYAFANAIHDVAIII